MSELNSRQWALYNFLKEQGDEWTKQLDIAYALKDLYRFTDSNDKFHDSNARQLLTADIRVINNSDVIQKIIISSPRGIKIANESEFAKYIGKEINAAVRRLMRAKHKAQKGNLNGQTRFVFNRERDTIEAFLIEVDKKE